MLPVPVAIDGIACNAPGEVSGMVGVPAGSTVERTCQFKVRVGGTDSAWELAIAARGMVIPASRAFSASRIARSDGTCASNGRIRIHIPAIVPSPYPLWHTAKWGVSPFQSPTKGIEEAYGKATRLPTGYSSRTGSSDPSPLLRQLLIPPRTIGIPTNVVDLEHFQDYCSRANRAAREGAGEARIYTIAETAIMSSRRAA